MSDSCWSASRRGPARHYSWDAVQLNSISGREDDLTTEDIDESIRSLADIAEYDEAGLMSRREEIERELARLSDYTGGGTGDTTTAINDALDAVDQRLRDLGGSRSGIEQDALTALQDIRREYYVSRRGCCP